MDQKILKTGNSLAVTIPSTFVKTLGLHSGTHVATHIDLSKGRITYIFPVSGQLSLLSAKPPVIIHKS